jgi:hypothetical protein
MITISNTIVKEFYTIWNTTAHPGQRLGQAFYNFIQAHKIENENDKAFLNKLYQMDNGDARKLIDKITDYTQ